MGVKIGNIVDRSSLLSQWREGCRGDSAVAHNTYQTQHGEEVLYVLSTIFSGLPNEFIVSDNKAKRMAINCAVGDYDRELGDILLEEGVVETQQDFRALVERYSESILYTHYSGYMPPIYRNRISIPRLRNTVAHAVEVVRATENPRQTVSIDDLFNSFQAGESIPDTEEDWDEEDDCTEEDSDGGDGYYRYTSFGSDSPDFQLHMKKEKELNDKFKVAMPLDEYIKPDLILGEEKPIYSKARQEFNREVSHKIDWIFNRTEREGFNRRNIEMFTLDEITKRIEKRGVNINGKQVYDWKLGGVNYVLRMELDLLEHGNENVPPLSILTVRSIYKPLDKEMAFYMYLWNGTKFESMYTLVANNDKENTLKNMEEDMKYYANNPLIVNTRGWRMHGDNKGNTEWMDDGNNEWSEVAEIF